MFEFCGASGDMALAEVGLLDFVRDRVLEPIEEGACRLAESATSEEQNKQRIASIRSGGQQWRLKRPRNRFNGLSRDGVPAATLEGAGRMLKQHRSEVFTQRPADEEGIERFLRCLVEALAGFDWHICAEDIPSSIVSTSGSRPGPDGIPYAAWRSVADGIAPSAGDAMDGVMEGAIDLPLGTNLRAPWCSCRRKEPQAEVAQFSCEVASTRTLTLTDALPEVTASGLTDRLSALAVKTGRATARPRSGTPARRQHLRGGVGDALVVSAAFPRRGGGLIRLSERVPAGESAVDVGGSGCSGSPAGQGKVPR